MDGFDTNDQVIVITATNRKDILDHALTRPGRFDRQVVVPLPDLKGRVEILKSTPAPFAWARMSISNASPGARHVQRRRT